MPVPAVGAVPPVEGDEHAQRAAALAAEAPFPSPVSEPRSPLGLLVLFTLAVRALAFPFTENLYGDAVVRTELAERWLTAPHLISSFNDGVYQFGPLHTYVVAAFLAVWRNREAAGRLASLVFGIATVFPLHRVALRMFGRQAATWSVLAFALWGLHIQSSTTAGSEALGLCMFAWALDGLVEGFELGHLGPLVRSAVFLNLGCAVRYDLWMYIPLFAAVIAVRGTDRIGAMTRAIVFGGVAIVFPLWWMQGNERAMGDPLYPIHFIDKFHADWTKDGIRWLGETRMREWGAVFWPGTVLLTLTPLYGLLSFIGIARAFVEKKNRTLAILAAVPTAYYTVRAAVLLNFSPLARFAILQIFLCIPYAWSGCEWLTSKWPAWGKRLLVGLTALLAVAGPITVAAMSYHTDDGWGHTLKPISPVTTMPQIQMTVAHWLRDHIPAAETVLVDWDDAYTDIGVAFFSNIPEDHLIRGRWEDFPKRVADQHPRYAVLFKKGKLGAKVGVRDATGASIEGRHFHSIQSFQDGNFEVFEVDP